MSFVDAKYIGLISVRLQKFSRKKEGLYTFRCPYCGDSQKNKNKTRGYIYKHKNDHNFKCHNCGASKSFTNFLKDQDVSLYDQYVMERYKAGLTGKMSNTPDPVLPSSKPHFKKKDFDLQRISELNNSHPAKIYLKTEEYQTINCGNYISAKGSKNGPILKNILSIVKIMMSRGSLSHLKTKTESLVSKDGHSTRSPNSDTLQ